MLIPASSQLRGPLVVQGLTSYEGSGLHLMVFPGFARYPHETPRRICHELGKVYAQRRG